MRLSVLTLRLAPSAEPARHMTMSFLPDDGFFVGTPKTQLETCMGCEHLSANDCTIYERFMRHMS